MPENDQRSEVIMNMNKFNFCIKNQGYVRLKDNHYYFHEKYVKQKG